MLWPEFARSLYLPERFNDSVRRKYRHGVKPCSGNGNVLTVNGNPDPRPERFCAALCGAFLDGVRAGGRQTNAIAVGILSASDEPGFGDMSAETTRAFDLVRRSDRLMIVFPLWLDMPPPLLTQFFKRASKNDVRDSHCGITKRSVHVIVTMAMPAFAHRSISRAQTGPYRSGDPMALPGLEADKISFIASVNAISRGQREARLGMLRRLGAQVA